VRLRADGVQRPHLRLRRHLLRGRLLRSALTTDEARMRSVRKMNHRLSGARVATVVTLGLLCACSGGGGGSSGARDDAAVNEGGVDATQGDSDAGADSGTGMDAIADASAGGDAGSEAGADAGPDAGAEASADAGAEAGADAGADARADAGPDAGADADAGAATDAATADSPADADAGPPPVTISISTAHFTDYGKLRIAFGHAVNAATLHVTLLPNAPTQLVVTAVTAVDTTTVDATLAYYHLPRDYQLGVTGQLDDGTPFQASATIPGLNNGSRVAFLTTHSGSGQVSTWSNAPSSATTPLEAADGVCQAEASAAGLKGTFVAFLSAQGSYDAGCRAFGLSGKLSANCGQASMPTDGAPWLSTVGLPIVNGATGVVAGNWATPIPYFPDGTRAIGVYTWTGTESGAAAPPGTPGSISYDCNGWSATTSYGVTSADTGDYLPEYGDSDSTCDVSEHMVCMQVGGTFFGPSTLHLISGKRAFVSKGTLTGAMSFGGQTGVAAGDALCQSEASTAGYANASSFHAYLGTATDDALCHVLGAGGKVTAQCGLSGLPTTGPWERADGYPIGTATQLATSDLTAPISLAFDQTQLLSARPWTGSSSNGSTPSSGTCTNWTSSASTSSGYVGTTRGTTNGWAFYSTNSCSGSAPVYCFGG
jgi:hypothetical protein